jgi:hypothetical protein
MAVEIMIALDLSLFFRVRISAIEARADGDTVAVQIWRKCDRHLAETVQVKLVASDKLKSGCIAPGKRATSSVGSRGSVWQ